MRLLQSTIDEAQKGVTGTARVKLYKGNCIVVGRKSPNSLYREEYATFDEDEVYRQKDAEGFIKINALRLSVYSGTTQRKAPTARRAVRTSKMGLRSYRCTPHILPD